MAKEGASPAVVPEARPKSGATVSLVLPGAIFSAVTTLQLVADRLYYAPFDVRTPVTVNAIYIEVTTADAGKSVRVGIYRADKDWQPTSLVVDAGQISVNGVAVVSVNGLSVSLQPGRYLLALHSESNPSVRRVMYGTPYVNIAIGTSPFLSLLYVGKAYAALADPGTAWDTLYYSTSVYYALAFLNITPGG